jgi:hypothetical protein
MCCPHFVVPTETAAGLIMIIFAFFLCFPGEVEASNDHAMACFKLLLLVSDSFHIEMCSAEVALGHFVLPLISFPPVSIVVPMFHVRRRHTGAAVQLGTFQIGRRQTVGRNVLPHLQASEGTRVQALAQYLVPSRCHSPSM